MELQSAVIAISWGLTVAPPSSWYKGCPGADTGFQKGEGVRVTKTWHICHFPLFMTFAVPQREGGGGGGGGGGVTPKTPTPYLGSAPGSPDKHYILGSSNSATCYSPICAMVKAENYTPWVQFYG